MNSVWNKGRTRWPRKASILLAVILLMGCSTPPLVRVEPTAIVIPTLPTVTASPQPTSTEPPVPAPVEQTPAPPTATTAPPTAAPTSAPTAPALRTDLLTQLCWVAYAPTHYDPTKTPIQYPGEEEVSKDLQVLHQAGFTGLVTYTAGFEVPGQPEKFIDIPKLAQAAGFKGMIMGVWDPASEAELKIAEMAAQSPILVGYSVGNEGLDERYNLDTLTAAMERLRRATQKPVTTTEQVGDYYRSSPLWKISDWIFPNAHPFFSNIRDPKEAVDWTETVFNNLSGVTEKSLLLKEVGLPSGGDTGTSEANQAQYYQLLRATKVNYVIFEAFDAPWKHLGKADANGNYSWPDPEPHWGVFTSARAPKPVVSGICSNR